MPPIFLLTVFTEKVVNLLIHSTKLPSVAGCLNGSVCANSKDSVETARMPCEDPKGDLKIYRVP